jgi:hypothetical protein
MLAIFIPTNFWFGITLETSKFFKCLANQAQRYLETGIPKKWKRYTQKSQTTPTKCKSLFARVFIDWKYCILKETFKDLLTRRSPR